MFAVRRRQAAPPDLRPSSRGRYGRTAIDAAKLRQRADRAPKATLINANNNIPILHEVCASLL